MLGRVEVEIGQCFDINYSFLIRLYSDSDTSKSIYNHFDPTNYYAP